MEAPVSLAAKRHDDSGTHLVANKHMTPRSLAKKQAQKIYGQAVHKMVKPARVVYPLREEPAG